MEFNINDIYDVNGETIEALELEVEELRKKSLRADAKWRIYEKISIVLGNSVLMEELTNEIDFSIEALTRDHIENHEKIAEEAELYQAQYQIAKNFLEELKEKTKAI